MMLELKMKKRNVGPIGLDIGHDSVKMLQLEQTNNHFRVTAAGRVRLDPEKTEDPAVRREAIIEAIANLIQNGNFHGHEVVSCVPGGQLKITNIRLNEGEDFAVHDVIVKEMQRRFGLEPGVDAIDYLAAGTVRQGDDTKNEYIVFGCDDATLRDHIDILEQAKVQPVAIDVMPNALYRSFERTLRRQEDRERTVVFVDLGSRFTSVVFGRGCEINFVKQIPMGGHSFNEQIASKLNISPGQAAMLRERLQKERQDPRSSNGPAQRDGASDEQDQPHAAAAVATEIEIDANTRQMVISALDSAAAELAKEVALCFRYYTVTFRGKRVEKVHLTGGEAYEKILVNVLRRQLPAEVDVARPLRGFDMSEIRFDGCKRDCLCEWAVPVGLALRMFKRNETENES